MIDKKKFIKLSDLHSLFQERSDFYKNASAKTKEKYKKNKFFHLISQNKTYYPYYRDSKEIKVVEDGKKERKNLGAVIEGFTIKIEEPKNQCLIKDEDDNKDEESDCETVSDYDYDSDDKELDKIN